MKKTCIICIVALKISKTAKLIIYLCQKAQIAFLQTDKVFSKIFFKYLNYVKIFCIILQ